MILLSIFQRNGTIGFRVLPEDVCIDRKEPPARETMAGFSILERRMTLGEFKAWLDGFSTSFEEAPSPKQWEIIKKKLGEVRMIEPVVSRPSYLTSLSNQSVLALPQVGLDCRGLVLPVPASAADAEYMKDRTKVVS